MKWNENANELKCSEMKWNETKRNEMKWNENQSKEKKRNEMEWKSGRVCTKSNEGATCHANENRLAGELCVGLGGNALGLLGGRKPHHSRCLRRLPCPWCWNTTRWQIAQKWEGPDIQFMCPQRRWWTEISWWPQINRKKHWWAQKRIGQRYWTLQTTLVNRKKMTQLLIQYMCTCKCGLICGHNKRNGWTLTLVKMRQGIPFCGCGCRATVLLPQMQIHRIVMAPTTQG